MKSVDYIAILEEKLLVEGKHMHGDDLRFLQDNASIHVSHETVAWLNQNDIYRVPHPAISPDLNPCENVFGYMSRKVYENGRQFGTLLELREAITEAWDQCPQTFLDKLVDSMPNRIFELIREKGGKTHY